MLRVSVLSGHRDRRRGAGRRAHDRARRGRDAGVHAGRDEGDREDADARTRCATLGAQILLGNTYHLHFRPGDELIAELGGPAPLHGLGRADPDRLRRLPGLLAPRHARRASTTTASRSAASTTAAAERFTPELAAEIQRNLGSDIAMCLDQVPPPGVPRAELEDAVRRTTEWARRQRHAERADGPAPLRDQPGRHRPRAPPPLGRGAGRARLRRQRDRRPRDRRGPRHHVRDDRLGRRAAPRRRSRATSWGSATPRGSSR